MCFLIITFPFEYYICFFAGPGLSGGIVGLMLTYTLNISSVFQQCVRQSTEVENQVYLSSFFIDLGYGTGLIHEVLYYW